MHKIKNECKDTFFLQHSSFLQPKLASGNERFDHFFLYLHLQKKTLYKQ